MYAFYLRYTIIMGGIKVIWVEDIFHTKIQPRNIYFKIGIYDSIIRFISFTCQKIIFLATFNLYLYICQECFTIYKVKGFSSSTGILVFCLAVCDWMRAATVMSWSIVTSLVVDQEKSPYLCEFSGFSNTLWLMCSVLIMVSVTVDRWEHHNQDNILSDIHV